MKGGDIRSNNIFSKILSIGYEFESHDLAKMSLTDNNVLVNSMLLPRSINELMKNHLATKLDNNRYLINDSKIEYIEYYDEPNLSSGKMDDGKYNVEMNITNDAGETQFSKFISEQIKGSKIAKKKLYSLSK